MCDDFKRPHWLRLAAAVTALICAAALPGALPAEGAPPTTGVVSLPAGAVPLREFGVLPENTAAENRALLQAAIDWASPRGAALVLEPAPEPYPVASGVILRPNVSLLGVHGPVGRGTVGRGTPVGSVLRIEDEERPFLTVESATQVRGLQFWYPRQTLTDPAAVLEYPPTIQVSQTRGAQGVTLSCLTFYGEFLAMDFAASEAHACEQILVEHCYGYPLGGEFVRIDRCYDVPRILHCHVNPANLRLFRGQYSPAVVDSVVARGTFAFTIERTDNAQLMDLFTFGTYGGARLGAATYGQLTNFNFDCVTVGILKEGDNDFNRNWQIAQGSIIANAGPDVAKIHPIIIEGKGHTAIVNVEAFAGPNPAVGTTNLPPDFLLVRGSEALTVSLVGCRMRNYTGGSPLTVRNPRATVRAVACFDKEGRLFEVKAGPGAGGP